MVEMSVGPLRGLTRLIYLQIEGHLYDLVLGYFSGLFVCNSCCTKHGIRSTPHETEPTLHALGGSIKNAYYL